MYNAHCTVPTSLYIGNQSTNHNVCQDGVLLECELCLERLPAGSVPMPRVAGGKARPNSLKEVKFLCPCCLRSRRPRYQ